MKLLVLSLSECSIRVINTLRLLLLAHTNVRPNKVKNIAPPAWSFLPSILSQLYLL